MGTARRQFTDEFKRESVGLLASSGRPLSQIARELGIAASILRSWRDAGDRGNGGSPRRSNTQAAIPSAGPGLAAENGRPWRENERLHMEREILKNAAHLLGSAVMKFRLIEDQRETFPVRVLCDVMGVSPVGGYYAWRGRPESQRKVANRALLTEIRRVHMAHHRRYGAPRSTRPCAPRGIRRAVAASNAACVITASRQ
jgi:transposase-like protein